MESIQKVSDGFVLRKAQDAIDDVCRLRVLEAAAYRKVVLGIDALGSTINTAAHANAVNELFRNRLRLAEVKRDLNYAEIDLARYEGEARRRGFNTSRM